ncbi:gluconate 2-dehydrogenase subunit 3 family protein [Pedobacter africanus]|uniref:Gluconate 2-dehydrogenase subunit 3 n=1 Tax=Pedobacter africanus TaxID=151894 RepID=A0A1W2DLW5_9SPHI|nr:gluconate 2-dehydrogenase subunit 3 family protein [Pedobacter africanus]SMC98500.1 Gluconate 2-dehydrogenase subunit 3 [Pedobacter africanus]
MNRRESLKILGLTTLSTAVLLDACKPGTSQPGATTETAAEPGRQEFEISRDKKLKAEKFFSAHEMATITVLADIIIPKDDKSGSASEAKVPEFIEFIVKDMPEHQLPMRGGLKWLDLQCLNRFQKPFKDASAAQQIEMVEQIAYPKKVKPGMEQGVAFFTLMRSLTASGFFTSEMGVKDLGYAGNTPNKWTGVPADVLKQYASELEA